MGGFSLREKMWEREYARPIFCSLAEIELSLRRCDALPSSAVGIYARFCPNLHSAAGGRESFLVSPRFRIRPQATTTCIQMYSTKSLNQRLDSYELSPPLPAHTLTSSLFLNRQLSTSTAEFLPFTPHRVTFDTNQRVPRKHTVDVCT